MDDCGIHRPLVVSFSSVSSATTSVGHSMPQVINAYKCVCTGCEGGTSTTVKHSAQATQVPEFHIHGTNTPRASPQDRCLGWPWSAALNKADVVPNLTEQTNQLLNTVMMLNAFKWWGVGVQGDKKKNHVIILEQTPNVNSNDARRYKKAGFKRQIIWSVFTKEAKIEYWWLGFIMVGKVYWFYAQVSTLRKWWEYSVTGPMQHCKNSQIPTVMKTGSSESDFKVSVCPVCP